MRPGHCLCYRHCFGVVARGRLCRSNDIHHLEILNETRFFLNKRPEKCRRKKRDFLAMKYRNQEANCRPDAKSPVYRRLQKELTRNDPLEYVF